jgi:tetratricopeptide (TPR) repeat protein
MRKIKEISKSQLLIFKGTLLYFITLLAILAITSCHNRSSEDYYNEGIKEFNKKNYKTAHSLFTEAIKINPDFAEAYKARAESLYMEDGQTELVIKDYNRAIELNQDFADAYFKRGLAKFNEDNIEALKDFNKALEIPVSRAFIWQLDSVVFPEYSRIYFYKGVAKLNLNDYVGAYVDLTHAIQLDSSNWELYWYRGSAGISLGDLDAARTDLEKSEALSILIKSGHNDSYKKSMMLERLAQSYVMLNLFDKALTAYSKAIETSPTNSGYYDNRAHLHLRLKKIVEACLDWSKSGELGNRDAYKMIHKYCQGKTN